MRVILVQEAKSSIIALEYDDLIFNFLSQEAKQELLSEGRKIFSRKILKEPPFTGQIVATRFRDHFIKSNYRLFKGSQIDCINFLNFYIEKDDFNPSVFVFITKYSNIIRTKTLEDFINITSNL